MLGLGRAERLAAVFLVLAAQFESCVPAVIVMATVPLGLTCAIYALLPTGGSVNLYSQIGLIAEFAELREGARRSTKCLVGSSPVALLLPGL